MYSLLQRSERQRSHTRIRRRESYRLRRHHSLKRKLLLESLEDRRLLTLNFVWLSQFGSEAGDFAWP
jgi:hypothetical protein